MSFLRRWLSHSVRLGLALLLAVVAMQAPAFTADYVASLLQVSDDARRDADQREASARQYYALPPGDDAALIDGLRPHEPSNAATLALSIDRVVTLRNARDRILASGALVQPLVALADAAHDPQGYKAAIWHPAAHLCSPSRSHPRGDRLWRCRPAAGLAARPSAVRAVRQDGGAPAGLAVEHRS